MAGDENRKRRQQRASASAAQSVSRHRSQVTAEKVALLTTHRKGERGKSRYAK